MSDAYADLGGVARQAPAEPPVMTIGRELAVANALAALQRVRTEPGSGDLVFLRGLRGKSPRTMSPKQCQQVIRLAWRYRFQLAAGLRPAADPDQELPGDASPGQSGRGGFRAGNDAP